MADEACYAAKEMGRNRFHVYQESDAELVRRHREMEWVAHIHDALANDRFHLAWQPIVPVRAASRGRLQLEILVRMTDASGAIVAPGAFLPAAERFGVVGDIDRWVIHAVFDWLDRHRQVLERLNFVSINLSGRSLGSDEILTFLERRVRSMPELFGRLCFEVTETATIANYEAATGFIGHLRRYGCRFALDDFGSGLSSFAYLRDLKVDFLKIDGAFVRDLTRDPVDESIVRYINEIGHVMGKQTIAEFVEDPQTLERLAEIGIDFAQGYAIAPPRPLDELVLAP
jgi:EAL domain-containing protein (putative c-di-GMP-specific phosphodiesterase class I)